MDKPDSDEELPARRGTFGPVRCTAARDRCRGGSRKVAGPDRRIIIGPRNDRTRSVRRSSHSHPTTSWSTTFWIERGTKPYSLGSRISSEERFARRGETMTGAEKIRSEEHTSELQ